MKESHILRHAMELTWQHVPKQPRMEMRSSEVVVPHIPTATSWQKTPTGRNYFLVPYVFHLKTREFEN